MVVKKATKKKSTAKKSTVKKKACGTKKKTAAKKVVKKKAAAKKVVKKTTTQPASVSTISAVFTRTLTAGASGADVLRLQRLLNSDPTTRIASSGVGSPGNETDYYGGLTQKAVEKFQEKWGVA